jgi:anti-anti-sigma factor
MHVKEGHVLTIDFPVFSGKTDSDPRTCVLAGEIDSFSAASLRNAFCELLGARHCVLDFERVTFLDSAGLGVIVAGARLLHQDGATVSIAHASPTITRLLHVAGLDRLVPLVSA